MDRKSRFVMVSIGDSDPLTRGNSRRVEVRLHESSWTGTNSTFNGVRHSTRLNYGIFLN